MLKLPQCPYCGFKYDYTRAKKSMHEKQYACKKCGKLMTVAYKKSATGMAFIFFVVLIVFNTFYLFFTKSQTIIPNIVFTVLFICLYLVLVPLKVTYGKIAGQEDEPEKLKKNRHRHKKTKKVQEDTEENPLKDTSFE